MYIFIYIYIYIRAPYVAFILLNHSYHSPSNILLSLRYTILPISS